MEKTSAITSRNDFSCEFKKNPRSHAQEEQLMDLEDLSMAHDASAHAHTHNWLL